MELVALCMNVFLLIAGKLFGGMLGLCEDSLGLRLTSFTEEKLGEKGCFSL